MIDLNDFLYAARMDYKKSQMLEFDLPDEPFELFQSWFQAALAAQAHEPYAMTVATVAQDCTPDARIVLLRGAEHNEFRFFTNYNSAKGQELAFNAQACLLFYWPELERQIRIKTLISKVEAAESDQYFKSRPFMSQIAAAVSQQSQIIENRDILEQSFEALATQLQDAEVPRPEHWGGYKAQAWYYEFWQGRHSRLHDRIAYQKNENGLWNRFRLQP